MKNNVIIEDIISNMHSNEKMPEKRYVVSEDVILKKLEQIDDFEQTDRYGRTLMINAAFYGRKKSIEYLIKRKANINAKDKNGFTALHAAVQEGNLDIIKLLLENGADIHARDAYGNPPILRTKHLMPREIFDILLNYGADPNEKNDYGVSAMDIYSGYPEIISILTQKQAL